MRVIDVVNGLSERIRKHGENYATAEIVAQGLDEKGDYVELKLRGDFKLTRDNSGRPVVVLK